MKPETRNSEPALHSNTIAGIISQAVADLVERGVPTPRLDAEVLLAHALGLTRTSLYARLHDSPSTTDTTRYHQLIRRRQQREPLQYITGLQEFWSLEFQVTPAVLIPRPETELIVETALRLLSQPPVVSREEKSPESRVQSPESKVWQSAIRNPPAPSVGGQSAIHILDVGTGSGCIAIALAKELPDAEIWATDISNAVLAIAQENAQRHSVAERVHFLQGDLLAPFHKQGLTFDLIASNPPYIIYDEIPILQPEVCDWEPLSALDGGPDGLNFYRRLLHESLQYLSSGGWLVMEIGHGQGAAVLQLAQQISELMASSCILDYEGRERVITVQKG